MSTPQSRLNLLLDLMRIPGVTATIEEDRVARFIYDWLASLEWFRKRSSFLSLIPTPLEGDSRPIHAVGALVTAARPTKRTIILTGHFDVVDAAIYGSLRDAAFQPEILARQLQNAPLDSAAAADLASGKFLFGRGSMDMKAGIAVEMELLRDFTENRELFNVNLLLLLVPDEENLSAGMRGALPWLVNLRQSLELEYLAAINAEPTEAGCPTALSPTVFMGTVGKLLPAFLCLGRESHVGAYYDGLSAALLAARIVTIAEGNPELADPAAGGCCPSWICLENRILREGYSVTVPGAAFVYFNCFLTTNSPTDVLAQMRQIAIRAAHETRMQLRSSRSIMQKMGLPSPEARDWETEVRSVDEIREMASTHLGPDVLKERLRNYIDSFKEPDPRKAAIAAMLELTRLAGVEGPLIVCGFLPPYYPPCDSLRFGSRYQALAKAVDNLVARAKSQFDIRVEKSPFFTGLCDLSYFGFHASPDGLSALEANMPGWGKIYSIPINAMLELDMPVVNFGPSGRDPHKKTERLEKYFSLEQYPALLEILIRSIGRENEYV